MALLNEMKITNKGKMLFAKVQAGEQLKFTKIKIGSGKATLEDNIEEFTDLIEYKFDVEILSITPDTLNKQAKITGFITNANVHETCYICELGLYAEDPNEGEILYGYTTAGNNGEYGDFIAPIEQGSYSWFYVVDACVGNASDVNININTLYFDMGVINSNTELTTLTDCGNQYDVNQKIDEILTEETALSKQNFSDLLILKFKVNILSKTLDFGMQNNNFLFKFDSANDIIRGIWNKKNANISV